MARATEAARVLRDFERAPAVRRADVLLLQEVVHVRGAEPTVAHRLAQDLGLHIVFAPAFVRGGALEGLAILSRYPLHDAQILRLKPFNLRFRSRARIAFAATVDAPSGKIRVFNAHLDTRINARQRLEQLAPVIAAAEAFPGPRIIGGDFNTANAYWCGQVLPLPFFHTQTAAVRRSMHGRGFLTPFQSDRATFDFPGMHLDWLYLNQLEPTASGIEPMPFSDHHAVWVRAITP